MPLPSFTQLWGLIRVPSSIKDDELPTVRPDGSSQPDADLERERSRLNIQAIEDFRPGYPRFTALISAHNPFLILRRFTQLRARLLLLKQDRLTDLEQKLNEIDSHERRVLFLGQSRHDANEERAAILTDIESCINDYDKFATQTKQILTIPPAHTRDVNSLQNWLQGTGCISREETAYLSHHEELMSLAAEDDDAMIQLGNWVESGLMRISSDSLKHQFQLRSNDSNIYIYPGTLVKRTAYVLLLSTVCLILLLPIMICNLFSNISARLVIVMIFTVIYLLLLSWLVRVKTKDLILAGATYATVLIVFVSGTSVLT
ncbi:hypothetical protein VHEMI08877 [[Torrubiella] hemipterigena]|uniref:DUF6594 domain-containing protein n=1 Tax=[Torrubiella] hemipterigena TaxID=1531966 RepID=A0A0A1TQI6_9HYPO|nr:hypothetical protein VHEMI08877 [[Torrubiella] hemipterigena]